jgi:hypothetical protein
MGGCPGLDPYSGFAWLARSRWGCCISSSFNIRTFRLFPAEELGDGETSGNWVFTGRAKAGTRKRVLGQISSEVQDKNWLSTVMCQERMDWTRSLWATTVTTT